MGVVVLHVKGVKRLHWTIDFHPQTTVGEVQRIAQLFNCQAFVNPTGRIALRPRNPRDVVPTVEELLAAI